MSRLLNLKGFVWFLEEFLRHAGLSVGLWLPV
jgi:hypothetical protein